MARSDVRPCERVLVMNDNRDLLETMKDVLELGGATVRTATTRAEALDILRGDFDPSVVIIDVRLGSGERGDDFARQLRADPRRAQTAIVLMSGDVHELRRLGDDADATVAKPFEVDHLFEVLSEMCAARGRPVT